MEISRREFISLSISVGAMMMARPAHAQPLKRRKNVNDLTPPELAKYRDGVKAMKALARDQPSSWLYQRAVHGIPAAQTQGNPDPDPAGVASYWRQCKHTHPHFFSWHRWELLYWEEFCRQLCGDPKFTLPYWDWMADAHLPDAYRTPADPNANPLYHQSRNALINNGTAQVNGLALNGYSQIDFLQFSSQFEGNPHGWVHGGVGSGGFDMGSVPTAGLDPVFYAHHANIDRHWVEWLRQGGARTNPAGAWLTQSFTFQSLAGPQTPTAGGAVTTEGLGYTYDKRPVAVPLDILKFLRELRRPFKLPPVRVIPIPPRPPGPGPDPAPWKSLAALSSFEVDGEPTVVPVPKESGSVRALREVTEDRSTDVAIELRGLSMDRAAQKEGFAVQAFLVPSAKDIANGRLSEAEELGAITSFNLGAAAEHADHAPPALLLSDAAKKLLNRSADKDPAIVLVRRSLLKDNAGKEIPFDGSKKLFSVKELHLAARKR